MREEHDTGASPDAGSRPHPEEGDGARPVRLDALDRRLLAVVEADPGGSYGAWAAAVGTADRTVARRYRALEDAGVVRVRGRTLPGFGGGLAWLTRTTGSPEGIARLGDAVARFPHSRWVRVSRDGTELMAGLVTPPTGRDVVLAGLGRRHGAAQVRLHELLRVWGPPGAVLRPDRQVDALDRALLAVLAVDGRTSLAELARRLGVDATTAGRRRARLIEEGILYLEADVDPAVQSEGGDAMLWMSVEPGHVRSTAAHLAGLARTRFVAATSGEVSLVAHVTTPTAAELVDFVDDELAGRGVRRVEVVPQGRTLKRTATGPV